MKLKRYFFLLVLLMGGMLIYAQQPDAEAVLNRTAVAFKNAGGIKASFTVRSSEGSSQGVIRLKGEKFLLESEGMTTWFDGHTQWTYVSSTEEVNVSNPTPEELQSMNPYALLSLYKKGYRPKLGKLDNAQNNTLFKVVLTATDRKQDLQCIILYVKKDSYQPVRVSMAQRGGEVVLVLIDSYLAGQPYVDSLFTFDKKAYPNAELVDLR